MERVPRSKGFDNLLGRPVLPVRGTYRIRHLLEPFGTLVKILLRKCNLDWQHGAAIRSRKLGEVRAFDTYAMNTVLLSRNCMYCAQQGNEKPSNGRHFGVVPFKEKRMSTLRGFQMQKSEWASMLLCPFAASQVHNESKVQHGIRRQLSRTRDETIWCISISGSYNL